MKNDHLIDLSHRSSKGAARDPSPPIEMPQMIKMSQKSLVSSVSVSFSIFAYNSTRIQQQLTIVLTTSGPGPLQFNFANQFKYITRVKLWIFVKEVAIPQAHM